MKIPSVIFYVLLIDKQTDKRRETSLISAVARICCEEVQSWKLGHGVTRGKLQGRLQQLLDN